MSLKYEPSSVQEEGRRWVEPRVQACRTLRWAAPMSEYVRGSIARVSGSGFRVSGVGFWIQVQGLEFVV